MNLNKETQSSKKLSLSTFKEKMLGEIDEIKGGAQSCIRNSTCHIHTSSGGSGGTVDACHD